MFTIIMRTSSFPTGSTPISRKPCLPVHENQLGVNSNFITLNYVRYFATWNIIRNTLLSTEVFYEDADDSGGFIDEHLHRYGAAISIGYQLTPHVTLGLRYQFTEKDSNVPFRDYTQNRISFDGTYSFSKYA